MGTITINVADDVEKEFRETVKKEVGTGKGTLGIAFAAALKEWIEERRQKEIANEMIALLKKGFDMGKIKIKSRDELYDRSL